MTITPPTISGNKFLSLDARLRAARAPAKDERTLGWEADLGNLPTSLQLAYGESEDGSPMLTMTPSYSTAAEGTNAVSARTPSNEAVSLTVGARSGRIYHLALLGVQLTRESAIHFVQGMLHCIRTLAEKSGTTASQIATTLALSDLIKDVLLEQVEKIREQVKGRDRNRVG